MVTRIRDDKSRTTESNLAGEGGGNECAKIENSLRYACVQDGRHSWNCMRLNFESA